MQKKLLSLVGALSLGLVSFGLAAQTGDIERGKQQVAVCVACHQDKGQGMDIPGGESWPSLAGLDANYLVKQLKDFKSGERKNMSMRPFAMMLNDQQMLDIAAYYASLKPFTSKPNHQAANEDEQKLLDLGKKLATEGDWDKYIVPCSTCHGPDNQGAGQHFPPIAGQHAGYIENQLKDWQKGNRKNDPQDLMLAIAERMNEQEIKAVAAWLASQPAE